MLFIFVIYLVLPFLNGVLSEYKSYKDYKIYEIKGNADNIEKLITYLSGIADIPYNGIRESSAEIMIPPDLDAIFLEAVDFFNLQTEMILEDFSKVIEHEKQVSRRKKLSHTSLPFSWTAYYDVDDIYGFLNNMSKTYPHWSSLVVGGRSYEGRQILGLRINTPTKKKKPIVFIESGIHAREWITPATTTYFINQLLTSSDPAITWLRNNFEWHIFPTINPDGYHYSFTKDRMWRKTRSKSSEKCYGVDANRNWDYNWGQHSASKDPCNYQLYIGDKPFSEVETRSLSQYIVGLKNITAYIGFHSDVQTLLIPLSDSLQPVSNYNDLIKIGKTSLEYGKKVNGEQYDGPGTAAQLLYKASGGSMDWVRYTLGTPLVYTYELRGVHFAWPPERIPEQGEEVTQMLLGLFAAACKMGYC